MREKLTDGVTLRKVWNHYLFDRQLRLLFMDAIERIEVSLRVKISYLHTKNHEPFDYAEKTYFPHWKGYIRKLEDSKIKLKDDVIQGKQPYEPTGIEGVDSFFITYGAEHDCLPLWLAVGMIDYGTLIYFFNHSDNSIKSEIAAEWNVDVASLKSWLFALCAMRNACAHHGRVWNRLFLNAPRIPSPSHNKLWRYEYSEKAKKWVRPVGGWDAGVEPCLRAETTAAFLFVCRHLMRYVAPSSRWKERVELCLHDAQEKGIVLAKMGLPLHWETHPLWQ